MQKITSRRLRVCGSVGLLVLMAPLASITAQQARTGSLNWSVTAGADHSDNIARTADNEETETVAQAGFALNLNSQRRRLQSTIAANLNYQDYLDDGFDTEVIGGLNGHVLFSLVPERFTWTVQDTFGQAATDARAAVTPANRQNINSFTTGPDLTFPLGERTELQLQVRGTDVNYEDTPIDYRQYSGGLALVRRLSVRSSLSLNGSSSRSRYDQASAGEDYEIQEEYLRLQTAGARTTLSVDAGYTRLDRADADGGMLLRLDLSRKVGARSTLGVNAGSQFSDTAGVLQLDQSLIGVDGSGSAAVSSDPFRSDYAYLSWSTAAERTTLGLSVTWREENHDIQTTLDRETMSAGVDLSRRIGSQLSASVRAAISRDDVVDAVIDRKESRVGAGLDWLAGRSLSLQLRFDHVRGNNAIGDTRDYQENRAYAGLSYSRAR